MPELPEVETVVRTLRPRLLDNSMRAVWTSGLGLRMARLWDMIKLSAAQGGRPVRPSDVG